jgi:hypothetical protein
MNVGIHVAALAALLLLVPAGSAVPPQPNIILKRNGSEPVYRHRNDKTEATQRGTTESDEPRPAGKPRQKSRPRPTERLNS